ncbi:caspase family protein [Oryzibacter oryziterrae]|uniref:caspase family protein n=1 Tax=Oryzibacter oryziterrae TaxID=2766474 RepID=UPI001F3B3305|nr:caspase family protein [Oryzibacter oryziterrae]
MLLRWLAVFVFVVLPVAAEAKSVALVIGNNDYEEVPKLMKAVGDAQSMGDELERLGFKVFRAVDQNRPQMSKAMSRFEASLEPGDTALFFYSGHGFAIDGENYLLPTDVPEPGPDDSELIRDASFPMSRIIERLQRRGVGSAILVIDACRDNPFEQEGKRSLPGQRGLVRMDAPQGVFVLYSAGVGQTALDRLSDEEPATNSVFTRVLLKTLDTPGLTLVRLAKETQLAVRSLALQVGHEQTPAYYDQIVGDIVLNPEPTAPAQQVPVATNVPANTAPPADKPQDNQSLYASLSLPPNLLSGADKLDAARTAYQNARQLEAKGDALGARKAYLAVAEADLDVIDPYLRFATLLRVQDGQSGAREVLSALIGRLKSPALELAYALQFDGRERANRLRDFLKAHAGYGPALYLAAQEYGEDRLGRAPTYSERQRQLELLDGFLQDEADGKLTGHFLDQSMLGEWIDTARGQQTAVKAIVDAGTDGVTASFMRSNAGWTVTVQTPEPATAIYWRNPDTGEMTDLGLSDTKDPQTGKPMPNSNIELPGDFAESQIEVSYRDAAGISVGPFDIDFKPDDELYAQQKKTLEQLRNAWIETKNSGGKLLVYSTTLASYNCAIENVYYGLDGEDPTEAIPLPDCNTDDPNAIPEDFEPYFNIPKGTKRVSVQIDWYDGTSSDVITYKVKG